MLKVAIFMLNLSLLMHTGSKVRKRQPIIGGRELRIAAALNQLTA